MQISPSFIHYYDNKPQEHSSSTKFSITPHVLLASQRGSRSKILPTWSHSTRVLRTQTSSQLWDSPLESRASSERRLVPSKQASTGRICASHFPCKQRRRKDLCRLTVITLINVIGARPKAERINFWSRSACSISRPKGGQLNYFLYELKKKLINPFVSQKPQILALHVVSFNARNPKLSAGENRKKHEKDQIV